MKLVVLLGAFLVCVSVVQALALRTRDQSSYVCALSPLPESADPYPSILRKHGFQFSEDKAMVKNTDLPVDRWVFSLRTVDGVSYMSPLSTYFKSLSFETLAFVSHYGHSEMSVDILLSAVMLTIAERHKTQTGEQSHGTLLGSKTHLTDLPASTLRDSSAAFMVFNLKGFNKARVKAIMCRWRLLIRRIQDGETEAHTANLKPPCIPRFDVTVAQQFTKEEQQQVVGVGQTDKSWAEWLHYADWELAMVVGYPDIFDATVFVVPVEEEEEEEEEEDGGQKASSRSTHSVTDMQWRTVSQTELQHTYGIRRPKRSPCNI